MSKWTCLFVAAAVIVSGAAACGPRVPPRIGVAPGSPFVSWIIMAGDRENPDQEFVCQSTPRNECAVNASKPDAQVFGKVYFYYHGTDAVTRYEGPIEIGFFRGDRAANTTKAAIAVRKDESITHESVTGIVTSTPGTYAVKLDLSAKVETGRTGAIRETIVVVVR